MRLTEAWKPARGTRARSSETVAVAESAAVESGHPRRSPADRSASVTSARRVVVWMRTRPPRWGTSRRRGRIAEEDAAAGWRSGRAARAARRDSSSSGQERDGEERFERHLGAAVPGIRNPSGNFGGPGMERGIYTT